jgi:hypothetical protein
VGVDFVWFGVGKDERLFENWNESLVPKMLGIYLVPQKLLPSLEENSSQLR